VAALASRGHRAVPVGSAEEAVDLIDRIKFDAVFCAARLSGLNWVEFFERSRRRIGTFILLTEGYDAELARAFPGGEGLLLSKPIEESTLDAVLAGTENAAPLRRL
jgi:DNA-binding response OmpR family regulator